MDSYREHPSDFDLPSASEAQPADDVAAAIGTDERRMHVRAYNHWALLLDGREFPSIEDLEPEKVQDFSPHSLLLDFTCGPDNPAMPFIGAAIRDECGLDDDMRTTADVPSRSLLSRLTDHYMQIIANRAPIGFEAEFVNQREENICYRGILMPFSSDGETIDFIYGVINWKGVGEAPDQFVSPTLPMLDHPAEEEGNEEAAGHPAVHDDHEAVAQIGSDGRGDALDTPELDEAVEAHDSAAIAEPLSQALETDRDETAAQYLCEDSRLADDGAARVPEVSLDDSAGLADRLWAARETAEAVKLGEGRTRSALYQALALAYDFALAAEVDPRDYAELLEESGVKAQARAPMTPIVKLVFGIDYDKARLTEFAAALSFARRRQVELGGFQRLVEAQGGGLKALVAAERQARRPEPRPDTQGEAARASLRAAPALALADADGNGEFAVVVMRRGADGGHEPVAVLDDERLIERVLRAAA